jgi:S1-C subfamily serine protease
MISSSSWNVVGWQLPLFGVLDDEVFVIAIGQGRIGPGMAAIEWRVLFVVSVEPNSPAWNAGIRDGDFIVAFNGVSVESSDDLFKMLTEEKIGIFQDATVIRHDKKIDLRVTPVEARMRA